MRMSEKVRSLVCRAYALSGWMYISFFFVSKYCKQSLTVSFLLQDTERIEFRQLEVILMWIPSEGKRKVEVKGDAVPACLAQKVRYYSLKQMVRYWIKCDWIKSNERIDILSQAKSNKEITMVLFQSLRESKWNPWSMETELNLL